MTIIPIIIFAALLAVCLLLECIKNRRFAGIIKAIDSSDVVCVMGLGMLGVGLWMVKPWVSLSVVGGLLFAVSVMPSLVGLYKGRK